MDKLKRIEELDILIKESAEDLIFYGRQLALSRIYERQVDKEWFYKHKKSHQMLLDERHELKQTIPKKIDYIKDEITCDVHLNEHHMLFHL